MMERMNFSRLNMTGLGTARVNSSMPERSQ